jgi:hypothetical protein
LSPVLFEMISRFIAISIIGMVIKLTDDSLDEIPVAGHPGHPGKPSLAIKLGKGVMAYGLLLFTIAVSVQSSVSATLFLAAYAVGMVKDPELLLPTYLPAWLESFLTVMIGVLFWGWSEMISSFVIMGVIQLGDDYLDREQDRKEQRYNLTHDWGQVEVILLAFFLTSISFMLDGEKTLLVLAAAPLVNFINWKLGVGGRDLQ